MTEPMVVDVSQDWRAGLEPSDGVASADVNRQLYACSPPDRFATLLYGVFDENTRMLHYVNAGHNPAMVRQNDLFQNADRRGADVGRVDLLLVRGDVNHVRPVLAGTHDPIDPGGLRIIARDGFRSFRREPDLSSNKRESMWAIQGSSVDVGQRFLPDQVDNGERMVPAATVNGNVSRRSVGRRNHFVRVRTDGSARDYLQRIRVHDCECVVPLGKRQKGPARLG